MFYKRIIAFALSLTFILPFTVYADIGSNNVNYDNIVTEYEANFSAKGFKINRLEAYLAK